MSTPPPMAQYILLQPAPLCMMPPSAVQGMLTAMKQEVTRKHKAEKWALDDVVYHTEVTSYERMEQVTIQQLICVARHTCVGFLFSAPKMPWNQNSSLCWVLFTLPNAQVQNRETVTFLGVSLTIPALSPQNLQNIRGKETTLKCVRADISPW